MKRQSLKLFMLMALATLALSVSAAAQDFERYTVRLDFDFMVGEQRLPAGEYIFQVFDNDHTRRTVVVRNKETKQQALLSAIPVTRTAAAEAPLTFSKYGTEHYLTRVGLGDYAFEAIKTSGERKLAKQYAAQVNHSGPVISQVR